MFGKIVGRLLGALLVAAAIKGTIALSGLAKAAIAAGAAFFMTPFGMIVAGILAIGTAIYAVIRYWDQLKAAGAAAWAWLREFASSIPDWAMGLLVAFAPFIGIPLLIVRNWDRVVEFFRQLPGKIGQVIETIKGWFEGLWSLVSSVGAWFGRILGFDFGQEIIPDPSGAAMVMAGSSPVIPEAASEVRPPGMSVANASISYPSPAAAQTAAIVSEASSDRSHEVVAGAVQESAAIRQPIQLVLDGRVVAEVVAEISNEDWVRRGRW